MTNQRGGDPESILFFIQIDPEMVMRSSIDAPGVRQSRLIVGIDMTQGQRRQGAVFCKQFFLYILNKRFNCGGIHGSSCVGKCKVSIEHFWKNNNK